MSYLYPIKVEINELFLGLFLYFLSITVTARWGISSIGRCQRPIVRDHEIGI